MSTEKDKSKIFYYRQTLKGKHYNIQDFWQPGDAIRDDDEVLLREVKKFYQENGYSPRKEDMDPQIVKKLKSRFRIWKNVMLAAKLPEMNSAEMQQKRRGVSEGNYTEKYSIETRFDEKEMH